MFIRVHRNLNKQCWSITRGNKPVQHVQSLVLTECVFYVRPSGRRRTLREGRKNVHAFVCGEWQGLAGDGTAPDMVQVSYNPYRAGHFYRKDTGRKVRSARVVVFTRTGQAFAHV